MKRRHFGAQSTAVTVRRILKNWDLYLLILPVVAYFLVFHYYPMYGVQIAFKNFFANRGNPGKSMGWAAPF